MRTERPSKSIRVLLIRTLLLLLSTLWLATTMLIYRQINRIIDNKVRMGVADGLAQRMLILDFHMESMASSLDVMTAASLKDAYSYLRDNSYFRRAESKRRIAQIIYAQSQSSECSLFLLDMAEQRYMLGTNYLRKEETVEFLEGLEVATAMGSYTVYQPILWDDAYCLAMSFSFEVGPIGKRQPLLAVAINTTPVDKLLDVEFPFSVENRAEKGRVYLTDKQGNLLSHQKEQNAETCVKIDTQPNRFGIALRCEIAESAYYSERNMAIKELIVVNLLAMVVAVLAINLVVKRIQRSIARVTDAIEHIQLSGALSDDLLNSTGISEYDMILAYIARADSNVRSAMNVLLDAEREKRELEVMLLSIQINPHFLYNALNAVQWMARSGDMQSIHQYMKSLLLLLHYNLDMPQERMVLLSREIEMIMAYFSLYRYRYGNGVQVVVDVDGMQNALVPRFILQPLVENSLYHGLCDMAGTVEIIARASLDGEKLEIFVRDNGRGIQPEVLQKLCMERSQGMGIGIRYVQAILEVTHGSFTIENRMEDGKVCGTQVKIEIPLICCEETGNDNG